MKKIYFLFLFATLSLFNFLQAQSVTANSTTPNAMATYTFTYVNSSAIGSGTSAPNIFLLNKPTGYANFIAYGTVAAIAPYLSLEVNGNPVAINSTNFSIAGSWSGGIQLSASFQIAAGSTIKVVTSGIIANPSNTSGSYTFNWSTAAGSGAAIQPFSAVVTFSTLSTNEKSKKPAVVISPNPAKDFVTISNITKGTDVSVFDMTGKLLYQTKANATTTTIGTSSYKNGLYMVKVDGQTSKLLISK